MPAAIFFVGICLLAVGCRSPLGHFGYDNDKVRRLQVEETQRHIADEVEWERLRSSIGARVVQIVTQDEGDATNSPSARKPSGRAAAIAPDGYFLTAYHVVDSDRFYYYETRATKDADPDSVIYQDSRVTIRKSGGAGRTLHPGRIVWSDKALDLAIVKFPVAPKRIFPMNEARWDAGELAYSADDQGWWTIKPGSKQEVSTDSLLAKRGLSGNGNFAAAGRVLGLRDVSRGEPGWLIYSTMVARGGMSGSPLVNGEGELGGILVRVGRSVYSPLQVRAIAAMLEPARIRALVEADREAQ